MFNVFCGRGNLRTIERWWKLAQLIFKDSGLLLHEGQPPIIYQQWHSYNEEIHDIVFCEQEFPNRRRENQIWFYFPTLNKFFPSERSEHAAVKAFKSQIEDESRFDEIIDDLEASGQFQEALDSLNMKKVRRKLERLMQEGKITIQERVKLDDLVIHLTGEPPIG